MQDIRDILYQYYNIEYQSSLLGEKNDHGTFSVDEALLTHKTNGDQIWILGCINNLTKDFRIEDAKSKQLYIKKFYNCIYRLR